MRIDGWVKLEQPLDDGARLVVYDSLAGPAMGLHFQSTQHNGWQPFTIYRGAGESKPLVLTFALTGPGTAYIDEVSIAPVLASTSRRRSN